MDLESGKAPIMLARWSQRLLAWADANWKWLTFVFWIGIAVYYVILRWSTVHWFVLSDTDDNIRYVQVKDWLAGQGWYDLRQYRLDPPGGANIHWSRIVDLPLAGLMLFFRVFTGPELGDRLACAIAPLIPLLPLMWGLAFIVRRLSTGPAWIIAALAPLAAQMGLGMFMPMRIDHHGWQLALTVLMLAGVVDNNPRRGGLIAGLCSALSIAIGMEMMVYLAAAGALIALRWVFEEGAARRMLPYALSLGGAIAILFVLFASYANRQPVCDALSPIWVAVLGVASAGMVLLVLLPLRTWQARLITGAVVGAGVAAVGLLNWPQCFTGAYQISPELQRLWLVNIREAKPITAQARNVALPLLSLPVIAIVSALVACWFSRRDSQRLWAWAAVALMTIFAVGLLFWQLRAGPAAQLLAIPAASWAAWGALASIFRGRLWRRIVAALVVVLIGVGLCVYPLYPELNQLLAEAMGDYTAPARPAVKKRMEQIRQANARCRTLPALEVLDQLPTAIIFTVVDLGPRLIAVTHHSAVAGPYHRNATAILDIHHAFDGPVEGFRAIAARHHARYLLICPGFPEGTIYQARSPRGFYAQVSRGKIPGWLTPVTFKSDLKLPYTLYRIDYSAPDGEKAAQ